SETSRSSLPRHSAVITQSAFYRDLAGQQSSAYRCGWLQSDRFLEALHVPPADQVAGVVFTAQRSGLLAAGRITQVSAMSHGQVATASLPFIASLERARQRQDEASCGTAGGRLGGAPRVKDERVA